MRELLLRCLDTACLTEQARCTWLPSFVQNSSESVRAVIVAETSGMDADREGSRETARFVSSKNSCFSPCLGIDLIAAFYGCLYAGCVPITVRPPHPQNIATTLPTVKMIVEVRQSSGGLRAHPLSWSWDGGARQITDPQIPAGRMQVCLESQQWGREWWLPSGTSFGKQDLNRCLKVAWWWQIPHCIANKDTLGKALPKEVITHTLPTSAKHTSLSPTTLQMPVLFESMHLF